MAVHRGVSGPGSGSTAWANVAAWTWSTNVTNVDFVGLGSFTELQVLIRGMTLSVSGVRCAQFSTNNGASFFSGATDYVGLDGAGIENLGNMIFLHSTSATAARTCQFNIGGTNISGSVKFIDRPSITGPGIFVGSTSPINAVRILPSAGGNITAGSIEIWGR